jgi:hypothetical protein
MRGHIMEIKSGAVNILEVYQGHNFCNKAEGHFTVLNALFAINVARKLLPCKTSSRKETRDLSWTTLLRK